MNANLPKLIEAIRKLVARTKTTGDDEVAEILVGANTLLHEIWLTRVDEEVKAKPEPKPKWKCTTQERLLALELDPTGRWDVPNTEFPRVMSNSDIKAMLATKCAKYENPFWRDRDLVEPWLMDKGIKIMADVPKGE